MSGFDSLALAKRWSNDIWALMLRHPTASDHFRCHLHVAADTTCRLNGPTRETNSFRVMAERLDEAVAMTRCSSFAVLQRRAERMRAEGMGVGEVLGPVRALELYLEHFGAPSADGAAMLWLRRGCWAVGVQANNGWAHFMELEPGTDRALCGSMSEAPVTDDDIDDFLSGWD